MGTDIAFQTPGSVVVSLNLLVNNFMHFNTFLFLANHIFTSKIAQVHLAICARVPCLVRDVPLSAHQVQPAPVMGIVSVTVVVNVPWATVDPTVLSVNATLSCLEIPALQHANGTIPAMATVAACGTVLVNVSKRLDQPVATFVTWID
jgi:hypothetical protein